MTKHVFTSMPPLIDWMQNEYLTDLLVRAMKPKPGGRWHPGEVSLEWGERSKDSLQMYRLKATQVTRWSLDGEWHKDHPVDWVIEPPTEAPIALHMKVPGLLVLECGQLTVEQGPCKRYRDPTPPAPDPTYFLVSGPKEVTWAELLSWIKPPEGVRLFEQMMGGRGNRLLSAGELGTIVKAPCCGMYRLQQEAGDTEPWLWIQWSLCITVVGHYLSLTRGTANSADWCRILELPRFLDNCTVYSGTIRCDGDAWLTQWVPGLVSAIDASR